MEYKCRAIPKDLRLDFIRLYHNLKIRNPEVDHHKLYNWTWEIKTSLDLAD